MSADHVRYRGTTNQATKPATWTVTVLLAATLTVAACSSSGQGSVIAGKSARAASLPNASTTTDRPAGSISELYGEAKTEGGVSWYTSLPEDVSTPIASAFEKSYPGIKVGVVTLSGNTPTTPIEAEAKGHRHEAGVVSGNADPILLQRAGLIDRSWLPPDRPPRPKGVTLPAGIYVDQVQTNVVSYNPNVLKEDGLPVPSSYADFTKPQWRGKFSIDPITDDVLEALGPSEGYTSVLNLMKKIGANGPQFVTSHSLASSQVASGTVVAALSTYGYKSISYEQKDPSATRFVNPNPLPVGFGEIAVVKDAPHRAAARLFLDWYVSRAGQRELVSLGLVSIRTDVGNNSKVWDPSKWKPAYANPNISTALRNKYLMEYRAAIGYHGA